mmetsp:Transcript_822/g.2411  ORF Transcript_822/g.2411 Transcript_822/m.2411 type:complete len:647 (+) Transcript_822:171-2111(+)
MASVREADVELEELEDGTKDEQKEDPEADATADAPAAGPAKSDAGGKSAGSGAAEKAAAAHAAPDAKPEFKFFALLGEILGQVVQCDGFWWPFAPKYAALLLVHVVTSLSFVVLAYVMADGLEDAKLTSGQWLAVGLVAALNVVGRLAPFWIKIVVDTMKEGMQIKMGTDVIRKIFELPHDATISTPIGKFSQLIRTIYMNCDKLLPAIFAQILPIAVETLVAFVLIATFYGGIAVVQLFLFAAYTLLSYRFALRKSTRNQELMAAMMAEWGNILKVAGSYERAHVFGNTSYEVDNVRGYFGKIGKKFSKLQRQEHKEQGALYAVGIVVTIGFLFALSRALEDAATAVELVALAAYFFLYVGNLEAYATGVSNCRVGVHEYQTLHDFIAKLSDVVDAPRATPIARSDKPSIEFKNVSFSYGGRQILDDVSFKVEGGQTLGLVGSSGCGKSTVLKLLLRFCRASSGTILVDGRDIIADVTGESLLELISMVSQSANIFSGTIRENIAYGKLGASDAEILAAARLAELDLESGDLSLDKEVGENGGKLSGGQQQRVSLARAMIKRGSIYLLDEPTTGLDGKVAKSLQATLDRLSRDGTTICVTHHLEDLQPADQILYLDEGRIVERGTFSELMAADGIFAEQVRARRG